MVDDERAGVPAAAGQEPAVDCGGQGADRGEIEHEARGAAQVVPAAEPAGQLEHGHQDEEPDRQVDEDGVEAPQELGKVPVRPSRGRLTPGQRREGGDQDQSQPEGGPAEERLTRRHGDRTMILVRQPLSNEQSAQVS